MTQIEIDIPEAPNCTADDVESLVNQVSDKYGLPEEQVYGLMLQYARLQYGSFQDYVRSRT